MLYRRSFISSMALCGIALGVPCIKAQGSVVEADKWFDQLLASRDSGALNLYRFSDGFYIVMRPIRWGPTTQDSQVTGVVVPAGFVAELSSIPPAFWSLMPPTDILIYPMLIHDYLYWQQDRSREEADQVFRLALLGSDASLETTVTVYSALRAFGETAWKTNFASKKSGERRFLKRFPSEAGVSWRDYKMARNVFSE